MKPSKHTCAMSDEQFAQRIREATPGPVLNGNPTTTVSMHAIRDTIKCLEAGCEYARELLSQHDAFLGRTTPKNKWWAEQIESDMNRMQNVIGALKVCVLP